jgi:hypothetical protein
MGYIAHRARLIERNSTIPTYKTLVFRGQKSAKKGDITDFPYAIKLVILRQMSEVSAFLLPK